MLVTCVIFLHFFYLVICLSHSMIFVAAPEPSSSKSNDEAKENRNQVAIVSKNENIEWNLEPLRQLTGRRGVSNIV